MFAQDVERASRSLSGSSPNEHGGAAASPRQSGDADGDMLTIVASQRDRFRAHAKDLEEQLTAVWPLCTMQSSIQACLVACESSRSI